MTTDDASASAVASSDDLLRMLTAMPESLEALTREMNDAALLHHSADGGWSFNDILAHLRACADVWGGSILAMIERDHPTLRYVSPRTWIRKTSYSELGFRESLQAFATQRADLVRVLSALDHADWSRGATFTGTTRGREQTILSYAQRIVDHEREHHEQLETLAQLG